MSVTMATTTTTNYCRIRAHGQITVAFSREFRCPLARKTIQENEDPTHAATHLLLHYLARVSIRVSMMLARVL